MKPFVNFSNILLYHGLWNHGYKKVKQGNIMNHEFCSFLVGYSMATFDATAIVNKGGISGLFLLLQTSETFMWVTPNF